VTNFPDLMMGLDRCEHGRHMIDSCFNCPGGRSSGNPRLRFGQLIGYTVHGAQVRVPHPDFKNDPDMWVVGDTSEALLQWCREQGLDYDSVKDR
jgi:hypothetical protein